MMENRTLLLTLIALTTIFTARPANAGCWDYLDLGSAECFGPKGCNLEYEIITCGSGCTLGTCVKDGNSGECCGKRYDYAQINAIGKCDGCGPGGNIVVRAHAKPSHVDLQRRAELLQGYTPGLIMMSETVSYRPPRVFYMFNRCDRTYRLVIEDGTNVSTGGM